MAMHLQLRFLITLNVVIVTIFGFFILTDVRVVSADITEKCTGDMLDQNNRDGNKPPFPLDSVILHIKASNIVKAHEIFRKGLQQFLEREDKDLGAYLNYVLTEDQPFIDEYNQEITSYYKILNFIWRQYNETLCKNYAVKKYDVDKLDMCSVARFLSHKPAVQDRRTIMKRMGDALEYRCHPCTPYKRKEYLENIAPNTDNISPEGVSPEESLILCKDVDHRGETIMASTTASTTLPITFSSETTQSTKTTVTSTVSTTNGGDKVSPEESHEQNQALSDSTDSQGLYSPCQNSNERVVCDFISVEDIKRTFLTNSIPMLDSIKLILQPYKSIGTIIPADVLNNAQTIDLQIQYPLGSIPNGSVNLQIDPNAFRSTKNYTKHFQMNSLECRLLDLKFLSGFDRLTKLTFANIYDIQHCLPSLPSLPSLTSLNISFCTGMNEISGFPSLTNGLKEVLFQGSEEDPDRSFNDETVDKLMDWILPSSSETLEDMKLIRMKKITQVPRHIASFKALERLWLHENSITSIKTGALSFSSPEVLLLNMAGNGIQEIEGGAFQGNFKAARIILEQNNLTRFDKIVFGVIVEQQTDERGFINALQNPINCKGENICHLAWLKELINKFWAGYIKIGISCDDSSRDKFKNINTSVFDICTT